MFSVTFAINGTQFITATDTVTTAISGSASTNVTSAILFHDSFTESTISSAWSFVGGTWQLNNDALSQTSTAPADPKKAMVTNQTFPSNVMITAEVEVDTWNAGDLARAGVGLYTNTSNGDGYNLVFHGTNQVQFLDDGVKWGNAYTFNWQVGTWYWFQLEENNGTLYGKVWAAGTAEPQSWMYEQTGWTDRTGGAPALNGSSASSTGGSATVSFTSVSVTTTSVQPDTASAGSALTTSAGSPLTFSQATASGTAPLSYAWNFGDGTTSTGTLNPTHTYQSAGTYTATLTVTDALGIPAVSTVSVTVSTSSTSPILFQDFFTESTISSAWSFVGGTWQLNNDALSQTSTAPADPKKAMVTNQTFPSNVMITAEVEVDTWNAGDLARAGVGLYTNTSNGDGYNLVFHGTNQVQFLDDGVKWGNAYTFNWQVGTWYWFQLEENNGTLYGKVWAAGTAEPQSWMYEQTGWTDRTGGAPALNGSSASSTGGSATVSFTSVSVTTTSVQPDTASAGSALTTSAGSPLTFSQATASGTAPLSYAWNFGDGTTSTGTLDATHTYANPGTYTAELTVTDALGIGAYSTVTVTVNDVAPTVSLSAPSTWVTGASISFLATATDISPADQAAGFTYAWTFGDGGTATGASPSHTYASVGTYTVEVTATDEYGLSGMASGTIVISTSPILFQDMFTESTISSAWSFVGGNWQLNNDALSQTSTAPADPTKAMVTNQTFPSNVMITAEVQVNSWTAGAYARAGVGLYTNTSNGAGYNLVFHGTDQVQFLDDKVAWGNAYTFDWSVGTWYWFQLEENNGTLYGKVWAAGTAEPQSWMYEQTGWTDRTGGARRSTAARLPAVQAMRRSHSPRFR